ncbi:MAG: BTAD domain-containing putative transcriptional regulator [Caldilineaceae bacterium]
MFEGIHYAQQLVNLAPWNEDSHSYLIQLLAMNGQVQAALAQFEQCRLATRSPGR